MEGKTWCPLLIPCKRIRTCRQLRQVQQGLKVAGAWQAQLHSGRAGAKLSGPAPAGLPATTLWLLVVGSTALLLAAYMWQGTTGTSQVIG